MKKLIPILLLLFFVPSCEQAPPVPDYCWECVSTIYGKDINDVVCYPYITDIEDFKARLYDFYEGGCTNVECTLIEKGGTIK